MSYSLELSEEKQSQFWAADLGQYKAVTTAGSLFQLCSKFVGARVLDIGAADGSLLRHIERSTKPKAEVVGVDLAPKSPQVQKANCTSLPFPAQYFDTVFMTDVIEHLSAEDLTKALWEASRVLKSGGHMIVATVNDEDLKQNVVHCPHCGDHFHRWGHCQSFTRETLEQRLSVAFAVVKTVTCNLGFMAKWPILARWIYMLGLSRWYKARTFHHDLIVVAVKK